MGLASQWASRSRSSPMGPNPSASQGHPSAEVHDPRRPRGRPGNGYWFQPEHTRQDRVDGMIAGGLRAAGQSTVREARNELFRHLNRQRAGGRGVQPGEKIAIKPNLVA